MAVIEDTEDKVGQEPSTADLLASVRQIITSGGEGAKAAPDTVNGGLAAAAAGSAAQAERIGAETADARHAGQAGGHAEINGHVHRPAERPAAEVEPVAAPEPPAPAADDRPSPSAGPLAAPAPMASLDDLARSLAGLGAGDDFGARAVEGVAADVLRPMVRERLAQSLPNLIESLVRAEIERIAGQIKR